MFVPHDKIPALAARVAEIINQPDDSFIEMGWQDKLESIGNVLQLLAQGDHLAQDLLDALNHDLVDRFNELLDAHYA